MRSEFNPWKCSTSYMFQDPAKLDVFSAIGSGDDARKCLRVREASQSDVDGCVASVTEHALASIVSKARVQESLCRLWNLENCALEKCPCYNLWVFQLKNRSCVGEERETRKLPFSLSPSLPFAFLFPPVTQAPHSVSSAPPSCPEFYSDPAAPARSCSWKK